MARELARLADETGRRVRVAIEPEPGCVVETVDDATVALAGMPAEWIGVCLDACHMAVGFEDPGPALARLTRAGIAVVKAQLSSALRAPHPLLSHEAARLSGFVEPRFLHQTRERSGGRVMGVDDLDEALRGGLPGSGEWRVHFHVPVHVEQGTTQAQLDDFLYVLLGGPTAVTRHLEVETYTWSVLPPGERPAGDAGLVDGLARELAWVRERLTALGLEEIDT